MTSTRPNVQPDELYQAKQAAQLLDIAPSTLYRYTNAGLLRCSTRKCNGRRIWKGSELLRIWFVIK